MICEKCWRAGHYWFSDEVASIEDEAEYDAVCEELGVYGGCDMRQVFNKKDFGSEKECECGCHEKKELKHLWPAD